MLFILFCSIVRHFSKLWYRNASDGYREDLYLNSVVCAGCGGTSVTDGAKDEESVKCSFFHSLTDQNEGTHYYKKTLLFLEVQL